MEGWPDPAAMAPSWPPPAPLFPLHECQGNLVSAPCTSPLYRLTTTGQTSMTDRPKKNLHPRTAQETITRQRNKIHEAKKGTDIYVHRRMSNK
jgi:hypothetical protein